jgi:GntR family transcriptional regulator
VSLPTVVHVRVWTEEDWDPALYRWEQIANVIRQRIIAGEHDKPEDRLISEVALREEFDVARGTIRKAIEALREEGWIITKAGKGSIVVPKDDRPEPPTQ